MQQILTHLDCHVKFVPRNNSFGFQCIQHPKLIWTMHFKRPQRWKSLAVLGDVTDILKVFSNHVCYNTQAMPKFQVMNFLCHFSDTEVFEMTWRILENLWTPAIVCTCNSSIHKNLWQQHAVFYDGLINYCVKNIWNFHLPFIVY